MMNRSFICVHDVIDAMDILAPPELALDGDKVGLQVGDQTRRVNRVWIALEATPAIVQAATEASVDMIITHHALLYRPLDVVNLQNIRHNAISTLLTHGITVYSAHTNLDIAPGGVNDVIADKLKLCDTEILDITYRTPLVKLVVYVPRSHLDVVRDAIANAGAGGIGNYTHCTFAADGIGTFKPGNDATPFIGHAGVLQQVEETRLETIVERPMLARVVEAMVGTHPYEEVAYDVFPTERTGTAFGIGRIGQLANETTLAEFADEVKRQFGLPHIRYAGNPNLQVRRVAVLGGSGSHWISKARQFGADVLVTADIGHHDAADAAQDGIGIVDVTHAALEEPVCGVIAHQLQQMLGDAVTVESAPLSADPFRWR